MPTYEYECRKCGHVFEKFQSMTAERIKTCPVCRGRVDRLIGTGAGILFKGSGFYETDYRSNSYQKAAEKDTGSASESKASDKKETPKKEKGASDSGTSAQSKTAKSGKGSSDA